MGSQYPGNFSTSSKCQGGKCMLTILDTSMMSVPRVVLCSIANPWSNEDGLCFGHLICTQRIYFRQTNGKCIEMMLTTIDYNHIAKISKMCPKIDDQQINLDHAFLALSPSLFLLLLLGQKSDVIHPKKEYPQLTSRFT